MRFEREPGSFRGAALAAALLTIAAAGAAEPVADPGLEARVRREVAKFLERHHYRPDLVDADALAAEARRRSEKLGTTTGLDDWLGRELRRAVWAFAPRDARPDPSARYALPFDPLYPRFLNQGPNGADSHRGSHAFDFVMPVGTPLRAAREGVVARVVDGFTEGSGDPEMLPFANVVYVLHGDGTVASYTHLAPGIPVKEGQRVTRGQVIASSGNTGFSGAPHLHFEVLRNGYDGPRSIPFRFGRPGGRGFVPKVGSWVGSVPTPTIELSLYADGAPVAVGTVLSRRSGERVRIRVEALPPDGPARDITEHPRLQLVSMTPWILDVVGPGELVFRPMEQFAADWGLDLDLAIVGVLFLNGDREIGLGKVEFRLTDRKPKPAP